MRDMLIPTMLVGSYPQPGWLVDRDMLLGSGPPRVRMKGVWLPRPEQLEEAMDDAARLAASDQERAGLSIIGDGEVRRESYFNHFATALDGIDIDNPGEVPGRTGKSTLVPRVTGPIGRTTPVQVREVAFLREQTERPIKVTLPGAFTMARMALDEHYGDQEALIDAYAAVLNGEINDLVAAGADIIQIDEPHLQAHPKEAARYGVTGINKALRGVTVPTIVHMCFGYAYVVKDKPSGYSFLPELDACTASAVSIEVAQPGLDPAILAELPSKNIAYGVINLGINEVETPEQVAVSLRNALKHITADRLMAAPDCGMKYLSRDVAFRKLQSMEAGAEMVRREISG
jgi:5-methyltetrahydropteroyltriglutamate--homocysteine methyltransferase